MKDVNRQTNWYTRKDQDKQFHIKGERIGREGLWKTIVIGKYMEIEITYKQTLKNIIEDRILERIQTTTLSRLLSHCEKCLSQRGLREENDYRDLPTIRHKTRSTTTMATRIPQVPSTTLLYESTTT
eukprot:1041007-Amphidinium_carterae.1